MGQKTHPLVFRLTTTQKHKSSWFSKYQKYPKFLEEDYKIRAYIEKNFSNSGISKVQIYRTLNQIEVELFTSRPGIIISGSSTNIENLKNNLQSLINLQEQIRINIIEITNPDSEAPLIADFIVQQLEKRIAFRRVVRQAVQRTQKANIKGIKVQISGRLNGAEIARTEWIREGRVPLQTIRADIDYSYKRAYTTYGVLGVKVWLFKGEIL